MRLRFFVLIFILMYLITGCSNNEEIISSSSNIEKNKKQELEVNKEVNDRLKVDKIKEVNNEDTNEIEEVNKEEDQDKVEENESETNNEKGTKDLIIPNSFIGDWKLKANIVESYQEVSCQENGIGIYQDNLIIYAYEVNDYIICDTEIEEVDESSVTLRIKNRKTSQGRNKKDNTKLILSHDENNKIIKSTFLYETENGNAIDEYLFEKDDLNFLHKFYTNCKENNQKKEEENNTDDRLKLLFNKWYKDYNNIREDEFIRFNDSIECYDIYDKFIVNKFYNLEGDLTWESKKEFYNIKSIDGNKIILEVEKVENEVESNIGLYYSIELDGNNAIIKKYNYLVNNQYRFNTDQLIHESLNTVIHNINCMNNLYAFNKEEKELYNNIIGKWRVQINDTFYYLEITKYYIDFYKYCTGFIESVNYKINSIDVECRYILLDIYKYEWFDETNSELKVLESKIKIELNEDLTQLTLIEICNMEDTNLYKIWKNDIKDLSFIKENENQ
ncbi:MAG: hypothetical protein N4A63_09300 [Vallitalea sp.]|nr:hypothetical protein [Vallitalea sp.]